MLRKRQEHLHQVQRKDERAGDEDRAGQGVAGMRVVIQGTVCQKIEEKRNNVRVVLAKARDDCVALVHKHFDELEQNIES